MLLTKTNDKLIYNIEQQLIEKYRKDNMYFLEFNTDKLERQIYYIFDNIIFDSPISLNAKNINIIFKNCTFSSEVQIHSVNNIIFENNNYRVHNHRFLSTGYNCEDINELTIINANYINNNDFKTLSGTVIQVYCKKINIINSNIEFNNVNDQKMVIYADEINIQESNINGSKIHLIFSKLMMNGSLINSKNDIEIENIENNLTYDELENTFNCPNIIYNLEKVPIIKQKETVYSSILKKIRK